MTRNSKLRRAGIWSLGIAAVLVLLLLGAYREVLWSVYLRFKWSRIDVILLDDCDPNFRGPGPHGDSARFLNSSGTELFRVDGLNNCQSVGLNHTIALDPARFRIYLTEVVTDRILAVDPRGETVFTIREQESNALAVDPENGNLWVVTGNLSPAGNTVVFDVAGQRIASYSAQGFDLCYNAFDRSFWVVGDRVYKLDSDGRILLESHRVGWAKVAVAADTRDGGVWVVERGRPGVPGSADRLLRLDRTGEIAQQFDLPGIRAVACDPETGIAWAVVPESLLRFSPDGKRLDPLPSPAVNVAIGPTTGHIWLATASGLLRVTGEGEVLETYRLPSPSSQSWVAAR